MQTLPTLRARARTLSVAAVLVTAATALIASSALATEAVPSAPEPAVTTPREETGGASVQRRDLAQARAASARYRDVDVAYADGYEPVSPCVEEPGLGAMGVHLLNHERVADGLLDPRAPEILLYMPSDRGRLELVGVEYFQPDADQDLGTDPDRPSLFGVAFDGPMAGHGPGEPVHYDLHVWLWERNPAGLMAPFNPALSCPTDGSHQH